MSPAARAQEPLADDLRGALDEVLSLIAEARRQLGTPALIGGTDVAAFRSAEDELGAVVSQSGEAAETILAACEELDGLTRSAVDPDGALQACTARIFEACAFQDLVAQRVKKVATLIREIEARVHGVVEPELTVTAADAGLANGPALPQAAPGQADIDRLFAED